MHGGCPHHVLVFVVPDGPAVEKGESAAIPEIMDFAGLRGVLVGPSGVLVDRSASHSTIPACGAANARRATARTRLLGLAQFAARAVCRTAR